MTSTAPYRFPSVPWFEQLARQADESPFAERFRRLGVVDTTFAVRVGDVAFRLTFDGFGCAEVAEWDGAEPVDFVLDAPEADWRDFLERHESSLNSLVLRDERFHLRGDDQLGVDNFYRYNPSLEAFFELAASVPTVYGQVA